MSDTRTDTETLLVHAPVSLEEKMKTAALKLSKMQNWSTLGHERQELRIPTHLHGYIDMKIPSAKKCSSRPEKKKVQQPIRMMKVVLEVLEVLFPLPLPPQIFIPFLSSPKSSVTPR